MELRALAAEDAPRLVACFERCYGRTYPDPSFYDARQLAARLRAGDLRSVVAWTDDSEVVGHMALSFRRAGGRVAEAGHTVVDPRVRGQRLVADLSAALVDEARRIGLSGFVHYPTTAHRIMQRLAVRGGGIETGILLDYVPAETEYRGFDLTGCGTRHAVIAVYQPIGEAPPQAVHVPERYRTWIGGFYAEAALARSLRASAGAGKGATDQHVEHEPARGLARIVVRRIGEDLGERVASVVEEGPDRRVTHVDLRLADPAVTAGSEVLRELGFFFAALLPDFDGCDVLRLQRVPAFDSDVLEPRLETDAARTLLARIREDAGQMGAD